MSKVRATCDHASYSPKYTRFIKPNLLNLFDGAGFIGEESLEKIEFSIHTFRDSDKSKTVFIFALVEFGCELFIPHYFIEDLKTKYADCKIVVIGWFGRAFLYENLADEFWEVKESYMWLRDYTKAFQHSSKNIKRLEDCLKVKGHVLPSSKLGNYVLENVCLDCNGKFGSDKSTACPTCYSMNIKKSMFANLHDAKKRYKALSFYDAKIEAWVNENMPNNMFGIFARSRKAYGRNLDAGFYQSLINHIKSLGYAPVWMGEKQSVLPCPDPSVVDFSSMPEASNLRYTLQVIAKCVCTFQCWTASTRLAQITNTPFVLVESVDQIYGKGQEGKRLFLFTQDFSKQKIILCNYHNVCENMSTFELICKKCIHDFLVGHDSDVVVGLVDYPEYVEAIQEKAELWKTNLKKITLRDTSKKLD